MKLLDLFCGAGGAAKGYSLAGFDTIIGIDIDYQPRYPREFRFIQADAMDYIQTIKHSDFDLIHASPPCQGYSWANAGTTRYLYDRLIEPLKNILQHIGIPYVIENVIGADLDKSRSIILDGSMFKLNIIRRRIFETNFYIPQLESNIRKGSVKAHRCVSVAGHGGDGKATFLSWMQGMDITWMEKKELAQAIPPRYTEYIGKEFIKLHKSGTLEFAMR